MNPPTLLVIHGLAASGKYTIAKELAAITGWSLFHNHLTVDLLLSLFPFGSPEFVRHRERIWIDLMTDALAAGSSLIFTFHPESSVAPDFPDRLRAQVQARGGVIGFVEVACEETEIEKRIESKPRREFLKLNSLPFYRQLKQRARSTIRPSLRTIGSTPPPPHPRRPRSRSPEPWGFSTGSPEPVSRRDEIPSNQMTSAPR